MRLVRRCAGAVAIVLALAGCRTPHLIQTAPGGFVITSDPPGAWVLVRDCPTCADRLVGNTPYTHRAPARELIGKYVHATIDGYGVSPIRPIVAADDRQSGSLHLVLTPAATALTEDATAPAQGPAGEFVVTSAELTARYRPTLSGERTSYLPLSPDAQFLVVAARVPLEPDTLPAGTTDSTLTTGYETRLIGPDEGRGRAPVFSERRLSAGALDLEQVFSIPRGQTGPYRLRVDGRTYAITISSASATAPPTTAAAETAAPIARPKVRRPPREAAIAAAATAVSGGTPGSSADGAGAYLLCAQVERFELCGERPCRADGLLSKTVLNCRARECPPGEVQSSADPQTRSLAGCVAACRQAQFDEVRDAAQGTAQVHCMQ